MSVVTFPRRTDVARPSELERRRRPVHRAPAGTPSRSETAPAWRRTSSAAKAAVIVVVALALSLAGTMLEASRQIELHSLQNELLQQQSNYAVSVGSLTNLSAPSQIATEAGALHLVDPTSVTQVPSTSLDSPLPLPKFLGYAPAISRTIR